MELRVLPPSNVELNLLTEWGDPDLGVRTKRAAIVSVGVHVALILTLALLPASVYEAAPRERIVEVHRVITPLIDPLTPLTQKAPNKGKVSKEIAAADLEPRPRVQNAPSLPASPPSPPRKAVVPPAAAPKPVQTSQAPPLPEPPGVDPNLKEPPKNDTPQLPQPPVPQIQPAEKPKIALEQVTGPPPQVAPGRSAVPIPGSPVQEAIRQASRGSSGSPGGAGPNINIPPSPGSSGQPIQLLSDPQGVDFQPYLTRVLASVKSHWQAVIPESVRYGRRGNVQIVFTIAKDGQVPKLVIANASGTDSLDRAAVAGISASVPFPPLPQEFKGDKIVLQFNFSYNMPKQ